MTDDLIATTEIPARSPREIKIRRQRRILVLSFIAGLAAWLFGYFSSGVDVLPFAAEVLPDAARIEAQGRLFVGYDKTGEVIGYAAAAEAPGYSGPIQMMVGVNLDGEIIGTRLVQQRESPGFFRLIEGAGLVDQFLGKSYSGNFILGEELDAVSGATLSAEGVAASAREALRIIAREGLDSPLPAENKSIEFGWPEISLLGLFAAGYIGHKVRNAKLKKRIRWGTLLTGMIVIGFVYTAPFTIAQVIAFLSGYWPDWQSNLYWYLLMGGILFATTVDAKNPYCNWFCPFGAFQEVLSRITNAALYKPREWRDAFAWLQRGLAFTAVLLGLAFRSPGVAGYEPFGTLFDLKGTAIQWIFLAIIILASLVMYRPFCNYLCPLDPVVDLIAEVRRWALEVRRKWQNKPKTS